MLIIMGICISPPALKLSKNNDLTYDKFDSGHTISQENLISLLNWINDTGI